MYKFLHIPWNLLIWLTKSLSFPLISLAKCQPKVIARDLCLLSFYFNFPFEQSRRLGETWAIFPALGTWPNMASLGSGNTLPLCFGYGHKLQSPNWWSSFLLKKITSIFTIEEIKSHDWAYQATLKWGERTGRQCRWGIVIKCKWS